MIWLDIEPLCVELVSYDGIFVNGCSNMKSDEAYMMALDIVAKSKADMLVFGGGLLSKKRNLNIFKKDLEKMGIMKELVIVVEVSDEGSSVWSKGTYYNCIHILYCKNGMVGERGVMPAQLFSSSEELANMYCRKELMEKLYMKMQTNIFVVKGRRCCVLQCGEINFLEGRDSVRVRGNGSEGYVEGINTMVERDVDVFLNVIHTPMGEQGVLQSKWRWLSENNRGCFAVCNSGESVSSLESLSSLQYGFRDGDSVKGIITPYSNEDVITRVYTI